MKQRLSIVLAFVFLATAIIVLECQLHYIQMELHSSADVVNQLCVGLQDLTAHSTQVAQRMSKPGTNAKMDVSTSAR